MNVEPVLDLLEKLGLKRLEANVYIFLAKKGPLKGKELCSDMKILKQQLYPCLRNLQTKGIINATKSHPATFSAVPFENVLDLSIKTRIKEAQLTQNHKNDLLDSWKSMIAKEL